MSENSGAIKYVDVCRVFRDRASAIDIYCKTSQRTCAQLAKRLANDKPKTPNEFEKHEFLKDFVVKTSQNNEAVLELLAYMKGFIEDILQDSRVLVEGAVIRDELNFANETIMLLTQQRNDAIQEILEFTLDAKYDKRRRDQENTEQSV